MNDSSATKRNSPVYYTSYFYYNPATTQIYTLSLHDALPISSSGRRRREPGPSSRRGSAPVRRRRAADRLRDRKSTRLNSSHGYISYAVFCLKKKKVQNDSQ